MDRYYVTIDGRGGFDDLSESQYFDLMNDLAIEFYRTGFPRPDQIHTEIKRRIMATRFAMTGTTIESRPKKTRQVGENTRNTRQPPVTRLVKDTEGRENELLALWYGTNMGCRPLIRRH